MPLRDLIRRWLPALIVAAMLMPVASVEAAPAPARSEADAERVVDATACHSSGWRAVKLPGASRAIGMDLAAAGGKVRWVVGMSAGASTPRQPWIVRRTTSGWKQVRAPRVGADAGLVAVSASSKSRAWAVGFRVRSRDLQPVALRWNGSSWRVQNPPGSSNTTTLTDVISGAQTWAVGYRTTARGPRPYAVRRVGSRWVRHTVPVKSGHFGALTAVGGNAKTGYWAAGWQSDRLGIKPLLARWQGGRWQAKALPGNTGPDTLLTGLTTNGPRLWVVGFHDDGSRQTALLFRRDPDGWARVPASPPSGSVQADDLVVAGGQAFISGGARVEGRASMAHATAVLRGGALDLTRRPAGIKGSTYLRAIATSGARLFSVGWTDGRAIAITTCRKVAGSGPTAFLSAPTEVSPDSHSSALIEPAASVRFRDVTKKAGLALKTTTYGATVLDANGDGWDDLLISRHRNPAMVLLNSKGRFVRAPSSPLARKDRHGCAGGDIDRDGEDEAFCAVGAARGVKFKSNELVTNLVRRNASNAAGGWGVVEPFGRGRRATFMRLDDDAYPDLVVTADPLRVDGLPALNRAYRNVGGSRFEGGMDYGLDLPIGGDCALSAQLDGTGLRELVLCTDEPWAGRGTGLHIFRRKSGRYVDATAAFGVKPGAAIDAAAADFDGDGRTDLAQLSKSRLVVRLQRGGKLKQVASIAVRSGVAIAAGDVNRDRRADLYIVQGGSGNAPDRLLINVADGRRFRAATIPQTSAGSGDDVVAIDHDRNGRTDFLVLNGYPRSGPIKLIAAYRN